MPDRHQLVGLLLGFALPKPSAPDAGQYASHIGVENGVVVFAGEHPDGPSRIGPDPGQRQQLRPRLREASLVLIDDHACRAMKVDGSTVVAKTGPLGDHLPDRSGRAAGDVGKPE